jgi:hypothetical protein
VKPVTGLKVGANKWNVSVISVYHIGTAKGEASMASQPFHGSAELLISTFVELDDGQVEALESTIRNKLVELIGGDNIYAVELVGYDGEWGDYV